MELEKEIKTKVKVNKNIIYINIILLIYSNLKIKLITNIILMEYY